MFGKKSKDEGTKKQKNDKVISRNDTTQLMSATQFPLANTSFSRRSSQTTTVCQSTSIRATQSTNTIYYSKDTSIPDIHKRYSVDATPFPTGSNNVGYQSPFSRRLVPISSPTGGTTSTTPSGVPQRITNSSTRISSNIPSITPSSNSIITSNPFNQQNRVYSSERTVTNRNPNESNIPKINSVGNNLSQSVVPEYNTKGPKRGTVLVINNVKFLTNDEERTGAENDEKTLIVMFKKFGFDVVKFRNLKKKEIMKKVIDFRSTRSLSKFDISIVIIMSHGCNAGIRGGYTEIVGTDGERISTEDIIDEFTGVKCEAMKGKPKIFIFQCCRGNASEIQVDVAPIRTPIKNNADVLIAYSTLPGFYSLRNPQTGSWYIQCICEVFQQHAKTHHVEDLLKIVDVKMSEKHPSYKQTSTYENRGFKKCYLNPK